MINLVLNLMLFVFNSTLFDLGDQSHFSVFFVLYDFTHLCFQVSKTCVFHISTHIHIPFGHFTLISSLAWPFLTIEMFSSLLPASRLQHQLTYIHFLSYFYSTSTGTSMLASLTIGIILDHNKYPLSLNQNAEHLLKNWVWICYVCLPTSILWVKFI